MNVPPLLVLISFDINSVIAGGVFHTVCESMQQRATNAHMNVNEKAAWTTGNDEMDQHLVSRAPSENILMEFARLPQEKRLHVMKGVVHTKPNNIDGYLRIEETICFQLVLWTQFSLRW